VDTDLLRKWLALDDRKRQLKADLESVMADLDEINEAVQAQFADNGIDNIRLDGRTVYISCDRWPRAKGGDKPALVEALRRNGLEQYVKEDFNTQSLRGLTNEMIRNYEAELTPERRATFSVNDAIPEGLRDYLEITEVYNVKSRKA
jgi:hypothetical protein